MIYLFSPKNYIGLDALTTAIGATRLFRFDGDDFWDKAKKSRLTIPTGSTIISWGTLLPEFEGLRVLNAVERIPSKVEMISTITTNGISAVESYPESANSPASWLSAGTAYMPRKFGEKISLDDTPVVNPDYYVRRHSFVKEFTIHSFSGRSIRAGQRVPMDGRTVAASFEIWKANPTVFAHPTIRSFEGGWTTDYTVPSTPDLRAIAHKAISVLGWTFGVVEIGQLSNNNLYVINVGCAPELKGTNAIKAYAKAINKWLEGVTTHAAL